MKKRRIFCAAVLVILLSLWAYGTLAFFTADDIAHNVITSGSIGIGIIEQDGKGDPYKDPVNVVPGVAVDKVVTVENTSQNPCFVRVKVDVEFTGVKGIVPDPSLAVFDYNTTDWTKSGAYYYYGKVLKAGETTKPLFTKVIFDRNMGNGYQNSRALIDVKAQAVQSENNGNNPLAAAGWPK